MCARRQRSRSVVHSVLAAAACITAVATASADVVRVAVAANFTGAAREIGDLFAESTGHEALLSFGSTGQLYTQITQGAPFDVFLAADQTRPARTVDDGYAVQGSRFTYAMGRIVLFSRDDNLVRGASTLKNRSHFTRLAVANPATAPYGVAAMEAMRALGVYDMLASRIVQGTNISQTYQFVQTGNAEVGFVALSQVTKHEQGSRWIVPAALHDPIAQDAVLLTGGADNPAARVFYGFLKSPEARDIIVEYGYDAGNDR